MPESKDFRIAFTRDFLTSDGRIGWGDIGLDTLDKTKGVSYEFLQDDLLELRPGSLAEYDAAIILTTRISRASLEGADRLLLIARFGVGYDNVDIEACTQAGVIVTITPDGVRRPVAMSALTLLLALSHRLLQKDRLVRDQRWAEKLVYMGYGVTGRTVGLVGWGNIGQEFSRLVEPLGLRQLAYDPYANKKAAAEAGVKLVMLDRLLTNADFLVLTCALTPETYHLIDSPRLSRMKHTAFLINVSRGPVVDQRALVHALETGVIAGAGLDVFEDEPPQMDDPLLTMENVILSPHAICWTDELALGNGRSAIGAALDVAAGRRPVHVVNPVVLDHPRIKSMMVTSRF